MHVLSWFMSLRRLGEFGDLALVHDEEPDRWGKRWTVWEVQTQNHERHLRYRIGEGDTPRAAFRDAQRKLRAERVRQTHA